MTDFAGLPEHHLPSNLTTSRKQVIEETQEICSLCGGRGVEQNMAVTCGTSTCRQCSGAGYLITKRVIRTEL